MSDGPKSDDGLPILGDPTVRDPTVRDPTVRDGSDLIELATDPADLERLARDASITETTVPGQEEPLVLSLEDLLPDIEGEVVVLTENWAAVSLITSEALAGQGVAEPHITASGLEVDGLYYYSFANGVTLYSDTDLLIIQEAVSS